MTNWLGRTQLLVGEEKLNKLKDKHVMIAGLGGVGSFAAEFICRSGIGEMTILDADVVDVTNMNRQLPALKSTIGKDKTEIMSSRLLDINPELKLNVEKTFLKDGNIPEVLDKPFDYVVDAIDTLSPKIYLIYHALQKKHKIVSSMGAGGKFDPTKIEIADIKKSYNCKLARMLRKRLHKLGVYNGVKVVFSPEQTAKEAVMIDEGENKKSNVGTISYMPATFGCCCASVVINDLLAQE